MAQKLGLAFLDTGAMYRAATWLVLHSDVEAGDTEKATERQRAAAKALDKAAGKGVIHKNQAANRKSALAKAAAKV